MSYREKLEQMTDEQLIKELGNALDTAILVVAYEMEWRREG